MHKLPLINALIIASGLFAGGGCIVGDGAPGTPRPGDSHSSDTPNHIILDIKDGDSTLHDEDTGLTIHGWRVNSFEYHATITNETNLIYDVTGDGQGRCKGTGQITDPPGWAQAYDVKRLFSGKSMELDMSCTFGFDDHITAWFGASTSFVGFDWRP